MSDFDAKGRLATLSTIVRSSMEKMMSEKMALQFEKNRISPSVFTRKLLKVMEDSLKSEKERHIEKLTAEFDKVSAECQSLRQQLAQSQKRHAHENSIIATDNAILQRKYEDLDGHYKALGWRKDQKEVAYQGEIQARDRVIHFFRKALNLSQGANRLLRDNIRELQEYVAISGRKNLHALKRMKLEILNNCYAHIQKASARQKRKDDRQIFEIQTQYQTEKLKHDQLIGSTELLLDSIWNISPLRKNTPKIPIDELPRRVSEVYSLLEGAIQDQRKVIAEEVKRDLALSFPDLPPPEGDTVQEAISSIIAEKDAQFTERIRIYERKEKKLRRTLESTLSQVKGPNDIAVVEKRKFPSPVASKRRNGDKSRSMIEMGEIERLKNDWEVQRKQLDSTMSELARAMPSSERSQLSDSIFLSPHVSITES